MKAAYHNDQALHDPNFFLIRGQVSESKEKPERADRLKAGLDRVGIPLVMAQDYGGGPQAAIHTPEFLNFLRTAHQEWQGLDSPSAEVVPNVHPSRFPATYPTHIVGRAGWHMADTACPIGEHTFKAACASANSAVTAADMLLKGEKSAYALCRPPGHHAYADMAGGFCFMNNSAIATQFLRSEHDRVAILDVDVHHGNGTQGIFYKRKDVFTVSIHCDPVFFNPFFWGHACERGEGEGEGFNLNIPLAPLSGDDVFIDALTKARTSIEAFAPTALVVALGLDASEHDPLQGLSVTTPGFARIGAAIAAMGLPTVYVQEGGYLSEILTDNLASFMTGVTKT